MDPAQTFDILWKLLLALGLAAGAVTAIWRVLDRVAAKASAPIKGLQDENAALRETIESLQDDLDDLRGVVYGKDGGGVGPGLAGTVFGEDYGGKGEGLQGDVKALKGVSEQEASAYKMVVDRLEHLINKIEGK